MSITRRAMLGGGLLLASANAIPRWLWWCFGKPEPAGSIETPEDAAWYLQTSFQLFNENPRYRAQLLTDELERVRGELPALFERSDTLRTLMNERHANEVLSSRAMRIPLRRFRSKRRAKGAVYDLVRRELSNSVDTVRQAVAILKA